MGFLDNSRDIIVDAVLTDLGRRRLAEGTGRFAISKFALGDDEINYELFNPNNPSGSAYYDLDILQTPVFEAFTNNISTMNSKLVTYNANDILYLPIFKLNTIGPLNGSNTDGGKVDGGIKKTSLSGYQNVFLVAVDQDTETALNLDPNLSFIRGKDFTHSNYIRIDQGLDNDENANKQLSSELSEDIYTVEIDNRFGYINFKSRQILYDFLDDDDIALYSFRMSDGRDPPVNNVALLSPYDINNNPDKTSYAIKGSRGTTLSFGIFASEELQNGSDYWFNTVGESATISVAGTSYNWKIINTTVTVTGVKTGYSIDIPVSFIKKV